MAGACGKMTLGSRSGWQKNWNHHSPIAGGTRGKRKRNLGDWALACVPVAQPRFHPSWGLAATPSSPWHHALRWFYSELLGCKESLGIDNSLSQHSHP